MIFAVDSSVLTFIVNPSARSPDDPATGRPVECAKERVEFLIQNLKHDDTMIIATPVLAEIMVQAGSAVADIVSLIDSMARVKILPFDRRSAYELAAMTNEAYAAGDKKSGSLEPWAKVKHDRQIIAVARVAGAEKLYTDDEKMAKFARKIGMETISTWELPLPEKAENLFTVSGLNEHGASVEIDNVIQLSERKAENL